MKPWVNCSTCGYAKGEQCDNPACPANPSLSEKRREALIEAHAKRKAEEEERAMIRRARAAASKVSP